MSFVRREFPIPGTGFGRLLAPDKDIIWAETKVGTNLRQRHAWDERKLICCGPSCNIEKAKDMAYEIILRRQQEERQPMHPSSVQRSSPMSRPMPQPTMSPNFMNMNMNMAMGMNAMGLGMGLSNMGMGMKDMSMALQIAAAHLQMQGMQMESMGRMHAQALAYGMQYRGQLDNGHYENDDNHHDHVFEHVYQGDHDQADETAVPDETATEEPTVPISVSSDKEPPKRGVDKISLLCFGLEHLNVHTVHMDFNSNTVDLINEKFHERYAYGAEVHLFIDCRVFDRHLHCKWPHVGEFGPFIADVVESSVFKPWLEGVKSDFEKSERGHNKSEPFVVACFCKAGIHRSVCAVRILTEIFSRLGYGCSEPVWMSLAEIRKRELCYQCPQCHASMGRRKQDALWKAFRMWNTL